MDPADDDGKSSLFRNTPTTGTPTVEELWQKILQLERKDAERSIAMKESLKKAFVVEEKPSSRTNEALQKAKDEALQKTLSEIKRSVSNVEKATKKVFSSENPFALDESATTETTVQLPFESIYGIACLGPTQSDPNDLRCCSSDKSTIVQNMFTFWIMIVQNYFLLVVNYFVQFLFITIIRTSGINNSGTEESCKSQYVCQQYINLFLNLIASYLHVAHVFYFFSSILLHDQNLVHTSLLYVSILINRIW
jgi:hypothetical protein